jgi:hypothetical protein
MKTGPVGTELFHTEERTDGRTDKYDKADSRCPQFHESAWEHPTHVPAVTEISN